MYLNGSPAQLEVLYEMKKGDLQTWSLSPERITDGAAVARFLGDDRFDNNFSGPRCLVGMLT